MALLKKIKVLIVDDSILFRTTLQQKLSTDHTLQIVGTAVDPVDAMDKIKALRPDVLTLDVEMPKMNGIEFLKRLIPKNPIPVVVVTSLPMNALDAMHAGAVDFVRKPAVNSPNDLASFVRELSSKIKVASNAHVSAGQPVRKPVASGFPPALLQKANAANTILAIGASTGGTESILQVVKDLPANTPGIVIVQHIPPVFSNMYAQRLNNLCKMSAKEAEDGDRVERGKIIVGAGEYQLRLCRDAKGYYVRSQKGPRVNGHCPSVDVLFQSVAETAKKNAVGVILTGMGSDGAKGLLQMRQAGAYTIGQDKESCVVYGMPMVAYQLGAVAKQLPLDQIGGEMIRYLNSL
ncbi:chemotaxis response regulator protein-glutamate methylesterase [bacterium 1XD42-1]|nr:chemotaxis response regulator protein-glutamate methylesterase [Oscillospiraceae bacterium]RKJ56424.1 chemotaxis response regulator protein-glutamate methylesterase [bacterium 1XD42-8]RKJ64790.1 chemotaxis response regulator protein-glutamate methylesterase [bacterium 1XD42-1]